MVLEFDHRKFVSNLVCNHIYSVVKISQFDAFRSVVYISLLIPHCYHCMKDRHCYNYFHRGKNVVGNWFGSISGHTFFHVSVIFTVVLVLY